MGNLKNKNNNKKKLVGNARERENEIRVNIRVVCEERSNMFFFFQKFIQPIFIRYEFIKMHNILKSRLSIKKF